jgi:hypothetical protein
MALYPPNRGCHWPTRPSIRSRSSLIPAADLKPGVRERAARDLIAL